MSEIGNDVVFFPGAGSFGAEFQPLTQALKPDAWAVKYPGRFGRGFGVPAESFDELVRACVDQITAHSPQSVLLFGHSFGAYVAYAVALKLQQAGSTRLLALVVAGANAPGLMQVSEQAISTPGEAAKYLEAVDPSALADAPSDDWREIVVETAMSDLRLLKQFDPAAPVAVHGPIVAARGETDPLTSDAGIGEWEGAGDGTFLTRVFPGGHSAFLRTPDCASWVQEIIDRFA